MSKQPLSPESFLKEVAQQCGLDAATFEITEEEPGKVSLRGECLYVQVISDVDGSHVLYDHGLDGPLKKWGGDWAEYEDTEPFKDWVGDLKLMVRESKLKRHFLDKAFSDFSKVLKVLNGIHERINGYSVEAQHRKDLMHKQGKMLLQNISRLLGMEKEDFRLSSNKGGMAVSGEVTLHGDHLYLQLFDSRAGLEIMYRTCEGQKDFSGGSNHFQSLRALSSSDDLVKWLATLQSMNQPPFLVQGAPEATHQKPSTLRKRVL